MAIIFLNLSQKELLTAQAELAKVARNISIVIVLTRNQACADRVNALQCGIQEYYIYPYSYSTVLKSILGHSFSQKFGKERASDVSHVNKDLRLDLFTHQAYVNGKHLVLTSTEFRMLSLFMKYAGKIMSRVQIWEDIWGYKDYTLTNTIDVHISRLRKKLGGVRKIETVYGVGYRMKDDE